MAEFRVRLNRLESEIALDNQLIVGAQARIRAREEEMVSLRQQILVSQQLEDGSLPAIPFNKLETNVARRGIDAMECQACHDRPDDARLNNCGHLYCAECYERVLDGRCVLRSCKKRLRRGTNINDELFNSLCARFGVSFAVQSESEEDAGADAGDDNSAMQTPRAPRFREVSMYDQITSPQLGHFQPFQPTSLLHDGDSSEDDGFDDRSQRSAGYGDDGDSFVSEDEIVNMEATFETGRTDETDTSGEDSMSIYSESDGILEQE